MSNKYNTNAFREDWYESVPDGYSYVRAYKKRRVRKARLCRLRLFVAMMIIAACILTNVVYASGGKRSEDTRGYLSVYVSSGDTLWSIASEHAAGKDVRAFMRDIASFNNIDIGGLREGQMLKIPQ